jgi:hypothetical protein
LIDLLLDTFDTLLEEISSFIVLFYVNIGLSDVFHEVAGVVVELFNHLQGLVIFEDAIGEMTHEIFFACVSMQFIDNPYFLINFVDIFRSLVVRNINVQISIEDEFTSLIEFVQIKIEAVH